MPYLPGNRKLLLAFRQGTRQALREVYDHYAPGLSEFLRNGFTFQSQGKRCFFAGFTSPFDLENALQEVFLRAFSEGARAQYDGLRPYVNYLFAIGRNFVIDEARRREVALHLFPQVGEEWVIHEPPDGCLGDPAVAAEEREVEKLLAQFLEQCNDTVQTYFRLRHDESLTQEQVAERMQLTRIQIRRVEARFRRDLLSYLKGQGYLSAYGSKRVGFLSLKALVL